MVVSVPARSGVLGTETASKAEISERNLGWDLARVIALAGLLLLPVAQSLGIAVLLAGSGYFMAATLGRHSLRQWMMRQTARFFAPALALSGWVLCAVSFPGDGFRDIAWWIVPLQLGAGIGLLAAARRRVGAGTVVAGLWGVLVVEVVANGTGESERSEWLTIPVQATGLLYAHLLAAGVALWLWSVRQLRTAHFVLLAAMVCAVEEAVSPQSSPVLLAVSIGLLCLVIRSRALPLPAGVARPIRVIAGCWFTSYLVHGSIARFVGDDLDDGIWLPQVVSAAVAVAFGCALTVGVQRPLLRLLDRRCETPWKRLGPDSGLAVRHVLPMPKQRVYLHLGLAKTGTTYLQERLWHNRDRLAREGLWYPGVSAQDHFRAACHVQPDRYPHWLDDNFADIWPRLLAEIRDWPATSVLSHELFGSATAEQARVVLEALSFAEVHLVCTVRDLARQVPSVWQENLKNGYTVGFADFVAEISHGNPDDPRDLFWEFQDAPRILRTWAEAIPPERVHVITVPQSGSDPDLLWHRFIRTMGHTAPETDPVTRNNSSLDAVQSELLRCLNRQLRTDLPWVNYEKLIKGGLVEQHLRQARRSRPLRLPEDSWPWITEHTERCIAEIQARGYQVVGDLAELRAPRPEGTPEDIENAEILDIAIATLARMLESASRPAGQTGEAPDPDARRVLA